MGSRPCERHREGTVRLKAGSRSAAVDDGPFSFGASQAPLAGVVTRGPSYVEGVFKGRISVDGDDASEVLATLIQSTPFAPQIRVLFLDGVTYAGFNVVDIDRLFDLLKIPVISVSPGRPDLEAMKRALLRHVPHGERKWEILARMHPRVLETADGPLTWCASGIPEEEVPKVLSDFTILGYQPEPLRIARLLARIV